MVADFGAVIAIDPKNIDVLYNRGLARYSMGENAGAEADSLRSSPSMPLTPIATSTARLPEPLKATRTAPSRISRKRPTCTKLRAKRPTQPTRLVRSRNCSNSSAGHLADKRPRPEVRTGRPLATHLVNELHEKKFGSSYWGDPFMVAWPTAWRRCTDARRPHSAFSVTVCESSCTRRCQMYAVLLWGRQLLSPVLKPQAGRRDREAGC